MPTQYDHVWRILSGYSGMTDAEVEAWEEMKSERRKEERKWTRHFFRSIFPDCETCHPKMPVGRKKLDREAIMERTDIIALLASYGTDVRRIGSSWVAACPFHKATSSRKNFVVYPDKKRWYCFHEGRGGTVFDIVMEMEGCTFVDAMRILDTAF